jgi:hypothetical protein
LYFSSIANKYWKHWHDIPEARSLRSRAIATKKARSAPLLCFVCFGVFFLFCLVFAVSLSTS